MPSAWERQNPADLGVLGSAAKVADFPDTRMRRHPPGRYVIRAHRELDVAGLRGVNDG